MFHTVNLLLHKINSTNFISQKFSDSAVILAISVSKSCTLIRLVGCEGERLDCWIFVFPTILPFQIKISLAILSLHMLTLG